MSDLLFGESSGVHQSSELIDDLFGAQQISRLLDLGERGEQIADFLLETMPNLVETATNGGVDFSHALEMSGPDFYNSRGFRIADRSLATGLMVGSLPIQLAVGVATKAEDRGPIFFKHTREGLDGEPISVAKFRSYKRFGNNQEDPTRKQGEGDISRVGEFTRKTTLDELPQLAAVIMGRMSLVGPRAMTETTIESAREQTSDSEVKQWRKTVNQVRPGGQSLAQIDGGRSQFLTPEGVRRRIELDTIQVEEGDLNMAARLIAKLLTHPFVDNHQF